MRFTGLVASGLVALATTSFAADMPVLRGSQPFLPQYQTYYPWAGFYIGGNASWSSANIDLSHGNSDLVGYMLSDSTLGREAGVSSWTTLPSRNGTTAAGWGAFIGYNFQWDDAVVSVEGTYTRVGLQAGATDSKGRIVGPLTDGYTYDVTIDNSASMALKDVATARLRGGWAASWWMPYAFAGIAVGRADVVRYAAVQGTYTNGGPVTPFGPYRRDASNADAFGVGFAFGAGVDLALTPNLFARLEYEYVGFTKFKDVRVELNTVRGGLGAKF
jgi:opacity protein-like surface antigen